MIDQGDLEKINGMDPETSDPEKWRLEAYLT
jgi:hypothetical protein